MSSTAMVRRWRTAVLRYIDRRARARRTTLRVAGAIARRRGADRRLVGVAAAEPLPLDRSLQMLQWSAAVADGARFPRHFEPGDHLTTPDGRRRAAEALRSPTPTAGHRLRHQIGVDDELSLDDLSRMVEIDLSHRIGLAATRPQRGAGVDPELQLRLVVDVGAALEPVGITPFLMSGTLLGVVRDGHFMAQDYDVDLGLLPGVDVDLAAEALAAARIGDVDRRGPRTVLTHASGAVVDVFDHWVDEGRFWHGTLIHEWWNTPFGIRPRTIGDHEIMVPDDPDRYLDENYGDWSRPVAFYDISFDTPNRRYRANHHAVRFLYSRCLRALEAGDRWLLEAASRELRDAFGVDVTANLADSGLLGRARPDSATDRGRETRAGR